MTKKCTKCKIEKGVGEFTKDNTRKDRLSLSCIKCCALVSSIYRDKRREYWSNHDFYKETLEKRCSSCKDILPSTFFSPSPGRKDGLNNECKKCHVCRGRRSWLAESLGLVYVLEEEGTGFYKIGKSVESNFESRMISLQAGNPRKLTVLYSVLVKDPYKIEADLHYKYSQYNGNGEWFKLTPKIVEEIITYLKTQEVSNSSSLEVLHPPKNGFHQPPVYPTSSSPIAYL